jgi:hypothetical protein
MSSRSNPRNTASTSKPAEDLTVDSSLPMTAEQKVQLKQLAHAAYDFEAFDLQLTRGEAQRRINTLKAKLKLQSEPPHTG